MKWLSIVKMGTVAAPVCILCRNGIAQIVASRLPGEHRSENLARWSGLNIVESSLNDPTTAKPSLWQRATEELKEFLILSLYLYVCLGAIIIVKSAILDGVGVEFDAWGIAAIKALLLAKFMLIGKVLRIGETKNKPLVWPTLYQSFLTLLLLIVLTTLEEMLVGAFHHRTVTTSLTHVAGDRLDMVLATFLIMFLILVPYFAFRNLAEVLGPGVLVRLFFTDPVRRPFPPLP